MEMMAACLALNHLTKAWPCAVLAALLNQRGVVFAGDDFWEEMVIKKTFCLGNVLLQELIVPFHPTNDSGGSRPQHKIAHVLVIHKHLELDLGVVWMVTIKVPVGGEAKCIVPLGSNKAVLILKGTLDLEDP